MNLDSWNEWIDCESCDGDGCFSCDNQGGRHEELAECDYCQGTDWVEVIRHGGMCSECAWEQG